MEFSRQTALLEHQQKILSQIALGEPNAGIFESICLAIEAIINEKSAKCSILTLENGQLYHCSAPSLDPTYCDLVNGVKIGPCVGSCGTAAYRRTRVVVDDIETSPLWKDFQALALKFDLKSCWSTPIISTQLEVLGTFAIYHNHPITPSSNDLELIDYFVHFTSIALEKKQNTIKLKKLINDLESSNQKFNALTKVIPDSAFVLSENGVYVDVYSSSEELLSNPIDSLINKNLNDTLSKKDAEPIMAVIKKTLATNQIQVFEYELEVQKGNVYFEGKATPIVYDHSGEYCQRHVLWIARDITARKEAELKIEKLAYYDHLTKLPNRRLLTERLTLCIDRISRSNKTGALLFIDIDKFKQINDSLGHSAGDDVLIELSKRLKSVVRSSDTLARIGGDEFVALLEYVGDDNDLAIEEASIVAEKLQHVFDDVIEVGTSNCQVSGSIGICLIDDKKATVDNILQSADTAMYYVKSKGGNSYSFYKP